MARGFLKRFAAWVSLCVVVSAVTFFSLNAQAEPELLRCTGTNEGETESCSQAPAIFCSGFCGSCVPEHTWTWIDPNNTNCRVTVVDDGTCCWAPG